VAIYPIELNNDDFKGDPNERVTKEGYFSGGRFEEGDGVMIQRYNGIEKDDEGAYVYYDDHLAALTRDTLSAKLIAIQKRWPWLNFYPVVGKWWIDDINENGIAVHSVSAGTPEAVADAALKEIK
jgi:hypothetical protein